MRRESSKGCTKCRKVRPISFYCKSKKAADGLSSFCKVCRTTYQRNWKRNNTSKTKKYRRKHYVKNADKCNARTTSWRIRNPDKYKKSERIRHLRAKYKISLEDYNKLFVAQKGVCAICKRLDASKAASELAPLCVDHCHETGKVRGLLCHKCNRDLASIENEKFLAESLTYLEQHKSIDLTNLLTFVMGLII